MLAKTLHAKFGFYLVVGMSAFVGMSADNPTARPPDQTLSGKIFLGHPVFSPGDTIYYRLSHCILRLKCNNSIVLVYNIQYNIVSIAYSVLEYNIVSIV